MSLPFNDPIALKGLVQEYELECGFNPGDVSGNATRLKRFAAAANMALDSFFALAIPASGTWQLDDSNHEKYPIVRANIVAGQRDYPILNDQEGAGILDIYKVCVAKTATGALEEIFPVDAQSDRNATSLTDGRNTPGAPYRYDKTANGIFLDPIPNYDAVLGLEIYINREASYFTSLDTTKKPGVPGLFHEYFFLKPAEAYLRRNNGANYKDVLARLQGFEGVPEKGVVGSIAKHFSKRPRDERPRMRAGRDSNK